MDVVVTEELEEAAYGEIGVVQQAVEMGNLVTKAVWMEHGLHRLWGSFAHG